MDELIGILEEIRDLLCSIDGKLDDIRGLGIFSIDDVYKKMDEMCGFPRRSLQDVCEKLDGIETAINFK